ncbi:DUF2796 domain-containing protein [Glycocaulis profundi]|nr:DUF2796 domain-containing protein [Glycocaulis profundi]
MIRTAFCAVSAAALLAGAASAQETRQLGAHVHGLGELAVAADSDGALVADLMTPAYNLFGFERAPRSAEEAALIADGVAALEATAIPAFTPAAGCTLVDVEIEGGPQADEWSDDHDHDHEHDEHGDDADHAHGEHDHGDEHDHDHDDAEDHDHDHDHAHEHDGNGHAHGHSDVAIAWSYACDNVSALNHVDASALFGAFERFERIEVQFFDGSRSAAAELAPGRASMRIN